MTPPFLFNRIFEDCQIMKNIIASLALALVTLCSHAVTVPSSVLNPDVTPKTIKSTICVAGYTASIRPSSSYTNKIKKALLVKSGLNTAYIKEYELDHTIPLALGGAARNPANLKLQSWNGADSARKKDVLETKLQCLVCSKTVTLRTAQKAIYTNWQTAATKYTPMACKRPRVKKIDRS
jgi:hypothetical protein